MTPALTSWAMDCGPDFRRYCELLDMNPERVRNAAIAKYGRRCEPIILRRQQYALAARMAA